MTPLMIETYLAFVAAFVATGMNLVRARRSHFRRCHYAAASLVAAYAAVIYGLAIAGIFPINEIGHHYMRPWAILVLASLAAGAVTYWRNGSD